MGLDALMQDLTPVILSILSDPRYSLFFWSEKPVSQVSGGEFGELTSSLSDLKETLIYSVSSMCRSGC